MAIQPNQLPEGKGWDCFKWNVFCSGLKGCCGGRMSKCSQEPWKIRTMDLFHSVTADQTPLLSPSSIPNTVSLIGGYMFNVRAWIGEHSNVHEDPVTRLCQHWLRTYKNCFFVGVMLEWYKEKIVLENSEPLWFWVFLALVKSAVDTKEQALGSLHPRKPRLDVFCKLEPSSRSKGRTINSEHFKSSL